LVLEITDNGKGFGEDHTPLSEGIGIRNLTERLDYQGGEFSISSTPSGTTVIAPIPRSWFKGHAAPDIEDSAHVA
jgi:two-component system NarL family sensor kinase